VTRPREEETGTGGKLQIRAEVVVTFELVEPSAK
jgi:hypothetical protein